MRLNLGCGKNKLKDYTNVDKEKVCQPDKVLDLEDIPWEFEDNCADEILLNHVLEHLGESREVYLAIISELYRISKPGATIKIRVPHPRHDDFVTDPTHVRPILPSQFYMFSKKQNKEWEEQGFANTPLAHYLDVDFNVTEINWVPDDKWLKRLKDGAITSTELAEKSEHEYNIIKEIEIILKVIKPVQLESL